MFESLSLTLLFYKKLEWTVLSWRETVSGEASDMRSGPGRRASSLAVGPDKQCLIPMLEGTRSLFDPPMFAERP